MLLLLAATWLGNKSEVRGLKRQLTAANELTANQKVDLATLRGNQAGLVAGVNACNASVDSYKDVVEKLAAAGNAALAEVRKGSVALNKRLGQIDAMPSKTCNDAAAILRAGAN